MHRSQTISARSARGPVRFFAARSPALCGVLFALIAAQSVASLGRAQDQSPSGKIVARVNGEPIYAREVEQQLRLVLRGREAEPQARQVLQAQAIEQLIGRKLILQMLAEQDKAANEREIDLEIERIRKSLAVTGATLDEHLEKTQLDLPSLRRTLAWQLSWQRHLDAHLTEENLKRFYERRRPHFDGSQVRVAHILLKVADARDEEAVASARFQAAAIAKRIEAGELTFDEAAARHSDAPTGDSGGKIGFIRRHGSMPESFARAAFDLQPGQLSGPVVSPFGVHVIKCLEIKPGQRPWNEVRHEVQLAATRYLFDWIVQRRRGDAEINYTGALPHFKPGTREIVP